MTELTRNVHDGSGPAREAARRVLDNVERVIVGQRSALTVVLSALLSGGHVLLEDRPGVGKTVLARALAASLGLPMQRVQGTTDLLPTDITGVHVYNPADGSWPFRPGPVFSSVLLVDELNRATPKAQSALLEAMAESQVTIDGATMALPSPFLVIATQNPVGEVGTYPLVAPQLDRFAVTTHLGLPDRDYEHAIVAGRAGAAHLSSLGSVLSAEELDGLMGHVATVPIDDGLIGYVLDVVSAIRTIDPNIWLSVRVPQTIVAIARAHAAIEGRSYVAPEDIQAVAPSVLTHRLPRQFDQSVISGIVASVAVPVAGG